MSNEGPITRAVATKPTLPPTYYLLDVATDGSVKQLPFPPGYDTEIGTPAQLRSAFKKALRRNDPNYVSVANFAVVRRIGKIGEIAVQTKREPLF